MSLISNELESLKNELSGKNVAQHFLIGNQFPFFKTSTKFNISWFKPWSFVM